MNSTVVESTALAKVGYDDVLQLLRLEFRSRAIYQYFGVPAAVHQDLLQAPSMGRYFNRVIRGRFPYARVSKAPVGVLHQSRRAER
jgi:KTSC domain